MSSEPFKDALHNNETFDRYLSLRPRGRSNDVELALDASSDYRIRLMRFFRFSEISSATTSSSLA
jgi:hypothetical protein